ncbi:hypothetical protein ACFUIT_19075 [Streptomyces sp. NPDC057239]|uniref:hypothetical protein n=1 Tax=Streptomyces sp. NPDC057239 TaxID=3346061 RepID=UPI00362FC211
MSYDIGGMCLAGSDFDAVWTEMVEGGQLHQIRLGCVRAALEGFVRLLHPPDAAGSGRAIEVAEQQLQRQADAWLLHAREAAEHLCAHNPYRVESVGT